MKRIYTLLIVLIPSAIFAQSNYYDGYVLQNNGDTLKGYIDYREWSFSPKSINFKKNKEDKQSVHFSPLTIKGFHINGLETYRSYTGTISLNRVSQTDLPEHLDTGKKNDTLFIKQLATGKRLTLYYQKDDIKNRLFIAGPNEKPVELKYFVYYDEKGQITTSPIYKGQMLLYIDQSMPGSARIINQLRSAAYTEEDLERIVNEINDNKINKSKKSIISFYAGLGINNITTTTSGLTAYGSEHYTTISPTINAGINLFDNPVVQRFIYRAELSFSYVMPHFNVDEIIPVPNTSETYTFDQYTVSLTPQVIYNFFNKTNLKIYIDAGLAFNLSSYSNNQFVINNTGSGNLNNIVLQQPYILEPFHTSIPLQAGMIIQKKVELCVTYNSFDNYSKYVYFTAKNQTLSLGIKYIISK